MKILFVDQTGKLAGAERVLLDIVDSYRQGSIVALFEDGPFREALENLDVDVTILSQRPLEIRRESSFIRSISGVGALIPLFQKTSRLAREYDLIYVNTPKALVVGALASHFSGRPMVYHLHDILTADHFSFSNRTLMVALANRFAVKVIAVSEAAKRAFIAAGGKPDIIQVIYNGFDASKFTGHEEAGTRLRKELQLADKFVVGHFSRLSPWKGQHVLIDALRQCPDNIHGLIVGDALFGEDDYVQELHRMVQEKHLEERVHFLGFRNDVPQLMAACDVITHTSTAPEPCARVLIEAMLSAKPLVASQDGGTLELITHNQTGWFVKPGDSEDLARTLRQLMNDPENREQVSKRAQLSSSQRFTLPVAKSNVDKVIQWALCTVS